MSTVSDEPTLPPAAENDPDRRGTGSARELVTGPWLDELLARADESGLRLTGEGGFLPELIKAVLERGLAVELSDHLGYEKGPGRPGQPEPPQRIHPEDGGQRGGAGGPGGAAGPGLDVRAAAGPEGHPAARRRPRRHDRLAVRGRD